jgi:hypothetical protein
MASGSKRLPPTGIEILVLEHVCLHWSSKHCWRKNLLKCLLISTLDKVIYYKGTFLQNSTKPLNTKYVGWIPAKKLPFISTCVFYVVLRFLCLQAVHLGIYPGANPTIGELQRQRCKNLKGAFSE